MMKETFIENLWYSRYCVYLGLNNKTKTVSALRDCWKTDTQTDSYDVEYGICLLRPSQFPIVHAPQHVRGGSVGKESNASLFSLSSSIPSHVSFPVCLFSNTPLSGLIIFILAIPAAFFLPLACFILPELAKVSAPPRSLSWPAFFFYTPLASYISLKSQLKCQWTITTDNRNLLRARS